MISPAAPVAAIVLAAGKGTRMKSALPKVLHGAAGKPLLAWPIDAARTLGASPVVVVVGHGADRVQQTLQTRYGAHVQTALQAEQKGTGHAVQMAMPALQGFSGTVLILYGDTPLLRAESLRALLSARGTAPLALWTTMLPDATGYGRIVRDDDGGVARIVEHKDATAAERAVREVNPGVYAIDADFLRRALPQLSDDNAQRELYLTDLVAIARREGHRVVAHVVDEGETWGVNDRVQLAQAEAVLRARIIERAMRDGVSFPMPSTCFVDDDARFGTDVTVGPNVLIAGKSVIGNDVAIGPGCILKNTIVEEGAVVHAYSVCEDARIGKGAIVGPFARLRPEAVLEEGAHVGNFVELKKTRLGRGSKANHLAYLGDAEIGSGVNVGAGTITCNYDGIGKHKTQIGSDVFVGTNSTLVAPLSIEHGAYIAAGSVVTDTVPADAVAFGRARQVNKSGHAATVRAKNAARATKKG